MRHPTIFVRVGFIALGVVVAALAVWTGAALTPAVSASPASAAILHVVPGGATTGTCQPWVNACDLQYALGVAASGDQIWVKAGTYKPTTGSDRSATFQLGSGVGVYGGFAGTEGSLNERDWLANVTILSGDIGTAGNTSDNVYHVITASAMDSTAILDGFTVTGGNANSASFPDDTGGGMYTYYGKVMIQDVILDQNLATTAGGGMLASHSQLTLTNVILSDNTVTGGDGGGLVNTASSALTLTDVTFSGNAAANGNAGGMLNDFCSPTLLNVTFVDNSATGGDGGAMYNDLVSSPVMTNVTFSDNSAHMTSGFNGGDGGAILNYATNPPPRLINVTFKGNSAVGYDAGHPAYGGAMYTIVGSAAMTNTILWGNTPDQIYNENDQPANIVSLDHSVVQGGCPAGSTCTTIITADPLLGALGKYGGSVQTIPLLPGSSAIDTARDAGCPATDARGVVRPQGAHCDVGAFESSRFTLAIAGGDGQSTPIHHAFAQPLQVSIIANNAGEPVDGGKVTFTPPASGASASLATSPATVSGGSASVTATANGTTGAYTVGAGMAGADPVSFHLTNTEEITDYDIYIKDNGTDDGSVPASSPWWTSPDIWVRNDGDCTETDHENPIAGTSTTVCIRVRNRMSTQVDNITVNVYWASAALGTWWPGSWNYVSSLAIASLSGGAETVGSVPWNVPYITGHACLLARADAPHDPLGSGSDTTLPVDSVQNNNNIAQKNSSIADMPEITTCGVYTTTVSTDTIYFDAVNTTNSNTTVNIVFDSSDFVLGSGSLMVEPGSLWGRWSSYPGFSASSPTLLATAFPASMQGIVMAPYETARITMTVAAEIDRRFTISVEEKVGATVVGGIEYVRDLPFCLYMPVIIKNWSP